MNCKITTAPDFDRDIKTLAKRYPSIRDDYKSFLEEIKSNPFMGTQLGHHLHKVRFAITSKGKGKSGGARVITHVLLYAINEADVILLTIYDKTDQATITDKELKSLLRKNGLI